MSAAGGTQYPTEQPEFDEIKIEAVEESSLYEINKEELYFDENSHLPLVCRDCFEAFDDQQKFVSHMEWCSMAKQLTAAGVRLPSLIGLIGNACESALIPQQPKKQLITAGVALPCEGKTSKANPCESALIPQQPVHMVEKPFKCYLCGNRFLRKAQLKSHLYHHALEGPFKCDKCYKSYWRKWCLVRHETEHSPEKKFLCEVCGKCFHHKSQLDQHQVKENPYKCKVCGNCFEDKLRLRLHQRIHVDEKPFQCEECGKRYAFKYSYNRHRRSFHTGEKPWICEVCGVCFTRNEFLKRHQISHWRMDTSSSHQED